MIGSLLRRLRSDDGLTLVELSVAMILGAMVSASLVTVFFAFAQNTGDHNRTAELQASVRGVVSTAVVDLRQGTTVSLNGHAVESMDEDQIIFYTDRHDTEGPERVVYERIDCVEGQCELWVRRFAAEAGTGPLWSFETTPFEESFLVGGVLADQALFGGLEWTGEPKTKTAVASCNGSSPECDFPIVSITLRVVPPGTTTSGASGAFELHEEVRIRNA